MCASVCLGVCACQLSGRERKSDVRAGNKVDELSTGAQEVRRRSRVVGGGGWWVPLTKKMWLSRMEAVGVEICRRLLEDRESAGRSGGGGRLVG